MLRKDPSAHLSREELACKDGTPYPEEWGDRALRLSAAFESLRERSGGRPLRVLSAYRTPRHNRAVGGARNSEHKEGRALDLKAPKYMRLKKFHEHVVAEARAGGVIRGIGFYSTFVHVDVRDSTRLVHWSGTDKSAAEAGGSKRK